MQAPVIGIENEFKLLRNGKQVNGKKFISKFVKLANKPYFQKFSSAFRLWTGGALYSDGNEPEIATPPVELDKNCVENVANLLIENRNNLVELVSMYNNKYDDNLRLEGYSQHYNIYNLNPYPFINKILDNAALPLLLLLEQNSSRGVMIREKLYRTEFGGDHIVKGQQIKAAMAYLLGMADSVKQGAKLDVKCYKKYVENETVNVYTLVIGKHLRKNRMTKLKIKQSKHEITLQELLEHYFKKFRENIAKYIEIELVEEFVYGKKRLEVDYKRLPNNYKNVKIAKMNNFTRPKLAQAFARASRKFNKFPGLLVKTVNLGWDYAEFQLFYLNRKPVVEPFYQKFLVDRDHLVEFYDLLDTGALYKLFKKANSKEKERILFRFSGQSIRNYM